MTDEDPWRSADPDNQRERYLARKAELDAYTEFVDELNAQIDEAESWILPKHKVAPEAIAFARSIVDGAENQFLYTRRNARQEIEAEASE